MEERKDKQMRRNEGVGFPLRTFRDMGIEERAMVKRGKEEFPMRTSREIRKDGLGDKWVAESYSMIPSGLAMGS